MSSTMTSAARRREHGLEIHIARVEQRLVVTPVGEIDIVTGGLFLEALIAAISAGDSQLIVDLRKVTFLDSTGLAIFLSADRALRSIDGQLRMIAGPWITELLGFASMQTCFPLHPDIDDAVRAFATAARMP
jgi:anti-sigma B factor antagonist